MANTSLAKEKRRADSLRKRLDKQSEEGAKAVRAGMRTATGMGTAFALSYFETRYPKRKDVFGVPVSLFVGIGGVADGALGVTNDDQTNDLIQSAGDGALAVFAASKGTEMATKALQQA